MSIDVTTLIVAIGVTFAATLLLTLGYLRLRGQPSSVGKPAVDNACEQLRTILDNIADGVIAIDPQGVIGIFNPMAEQIFSYKESEVLGKNIDRL
jgi:PAS domain-containing protein